MSKLTEFVLKRPVTTVLAVLCLIVFGYQSITGSTMELMPDMDMSMMIINTSYSGASPEDVDELVTKPIEEQVSTLSGLSSITSTSSEGSSMVMLEYEYGTDMDEAYDDLKKQIDNISSRLPDDCNDPNIFSMSSSSQSDIMMIVDNPNESNLYDYVESEIVPEFEKLSNAAEVSVMGGSGDYIRVELIEEKAKQYGVTISSIASDIASANLTYPVGSIDVGTQELSVTTRMKYDTVESLNEIPLTTSGDGTVYLEDVAIVTLTNEEGGSVARYNGRDTIALAITKQQDSTSIALSSQVKEMIESIEAEDPDTTFTIVNDTADSITESLSAVVETMILAVVISMAVIWLFFGDIKASLIVGSSIPVSILATLIAMNMAGMTLNVITLSALTLAVGMMVDNSIVVLESCFRAADVHHDGLLDYMNDALNGTRIVSASVFGSTATTCVVFLPLAFITGMTGQIFKPLGFTIVFSMVASLISAVAIVPLCYMLYKPIERETAPLSRPVDALKNWYREFMRMLLPKKKTVMITTIVLLIASFKLYSSLGSELMASDDQGQVSISVEMRPGIKTEEIDKVMSQIEAIISEHPDVDSYMTRTGGGMMSSGGGSISVYLKDDREMSTEDVATEFKKELADITNASISVDVSGSMSMMSSFGEQYETIIKGTDYDELSELSNTLVEELNARPELTQVHSDAENASPVIEVTVDPVKANANGVTASQIGSTLYQLVSGVEADEMDVDGESLSVMIKYPEGSYESLDQIEQVLLTTSSGGQVMLTDVADVGFVDSPSSIQREDKEYIITITGEYTAEATAASKQLIDSEVVTPHLTDTITKGVNSRDSMMGDEFGNIANAIAIAAFLVFVVMAAQFESPKFSLMVMLTIPFSFIGSFGLMWLTDNRISMVSLLGFLMLIGTVVNAGILYVDTANQYRETMDRDTALIEAGATRMRPIFMTTLTTILSMIPMALAIGNAGATTQGLAIVNIGGLTASTILSLLMLPVFYTIMDGGKSGMLKKKSYIVDVNEIKAKKAKKKHFGFGKKGKTGNGADNADAGGTADAGNTDNLNNGNTGEGSGHDSEN